eukprot:GHUV01022826.1.p4 GENE.GHUV01022826.1~~GHUV01022826.1.p4  ORF type:complete len:116 (+),score=15.13 GHUV01022826.1:528-875(+)
MTTSYSLILTLMRLLLRPRLLTTRCLWSTAVAPHDAAASPKEQPPHPAHIHPPNAVISVGLQPLHRPHSALICQCVFVTPAPSSHLSHDEVYALFHLLLVGVTSLLNIRLGDSVS